MLPAENPDQEGKIHTQSSETVVRVSDEIPNG